MSVDSYVLPITTGVVSSCLTLMVTKFLDYGKDRLVEKRRLKKAKFQFQVRLITLEGDLRYNRQIIQSIIDKLQVAIEVTPDNRAKFEFVPFILREIIRADLPIQDLELDSLINDYANTEGDSVVSYHNCIQIYKSYENLNEFLYLHGGTTEGNQTKIMHDSIVKILSGSEELVSLLDKSIEKAVVTNSKVVTLMKRKFLGERFFKVKQSEFTDAEITLAESYKVDQERYVEEKD